MRRRDAVITLSLVAALSVGAGGREGSSSEAAPATAADPMAAFARMTPGEWRRTAQSGTSMFYTWHKGPGGRSTRVMVDGSDAAGNPWRGMEVIYWHPGRKQVRLLSLNPFARSVSEGAIKFEGETAEAEFDLYQTGRRRKMGLRWAFDGPDKYRETLLEATGPAGLQPLAEWDYVRSRTSAATRPGAVEGKPRPSERMKALEPLLGRAWETGDGDASRVRSTFEWVPIIDAIYARVLAPGKEGESAHLLDAYIYHHTGAGAVRCLALSNRGGVYEGDLSVLEGGSLRIDFKGYEGDQVVDREVRFDFEKDGTLRQRVWSLKDAERSLMLDARHKALGSKKD